MGSRITLGLLLGGLLLAITSLSAAAGQTAFVQQETGVSTPGKTLFWQDVTGDGTQELVVGGTTDVTIYHRQGKAWEEVGQIDGLNTEICSFAAGDLDGDKLPELLLGTGQPGSVRIFGFDGKSFQVKGRTGYVWSPIKQLRVGDVDGDAWGEIYVLNETGILTVFVWNGLQWVTKWRLTSPTGKIRHIELEDYTGDGIADLLCVGDNKLTLYQYQNGWHAIWENYPWGTITAISNGDVDNDGLADILVTTDQKILYIFGWDQDDLSLKRHIAADIINFHYHLTGDFDDDGYVEMIAHDGEVLTAAELHGHNLKVEWRVPLAVNSPLVWTGDGFLVLDPAGQLVYLHQVDSNYVRVIVDGREWTLSTSPVLTGDTIFLPLRDMADILGLTLFWDENSRRVTALKGDKFVIMVIGEPGMSVNGEEYPQVPAPRLQQGNTLVAAEVVNQFAEVSWDPATRTLTVKRN